MDSSTFKDPKIIKELNDNFYSVKFNAEQKEQIDFNGNAFNFVDAGRRGYHQLAYSLLDGRMAYPAFVMLNENFERVMLSPGYKQVDQLIKELTFTSTEAYKKVSWDQYKGS
jgi:thioredoxin-related protein